MAEYLDFNQADCKNCYRCLRSCPVKAIRVETEQARVIPDRCILCGHCVNVCPRNAKHVHSGVEAVSKLIASDADVIVSLAPSFVSSFGVSDFGIMRAALKKTRLYGSRGNGNRRKRRRHRVRPAARERQVPQSYFHGLSVGHAAREGVLPQGYRVPCARGFAHGRAREND